MFEVWSSARWTNSAPYWKRMGKSCGGTSSSFGRNTCGNVPRSKQLESRRYVITKVEIHAFTRMKGSIIQRDDILHERLSWRLRSGRSHILRAHQDQTITMFCRTVEVWHDLTPNIIVFRRWKLHNAFFRSASCDNVPFRKHWQLSSSISDKHTRLSCLKHGCGRTGFDSPAWRLTFFDKLSQFVFCVELSHIHFQHWQLSGPEISFTPFDSPT